MQFINLLVMTGCLVLGIVLGAACRGQLPPTEPPRVVEDAPGTRTDEGLGAPVAGLAAPSVGSLGGSGGGGGPLPLPGGTGSQSR